MEGVHHQPSKQWDQLTTQFLIMWPVQELWGREKKGGKTSKFSKLCAYVVTFFKYIS